MNTRARTALQTMKSPSNRYKGIEKEKNLEMQGKPSITSQSRREKKIALQQDVDKLKRKLRHEENVHRALERAFTRPLGALPRLPPYLPSHTLELLAEVAVLEEEVVRLEEQVVNCRQGLYQEAVYISSSKTSKESSFDSSSDKSSSQNSKNSACSNVSIAENPSTLISKPMKKICNEEARGKENKVNENAIDSSKKSPAKKTYRANVQDAQNLKNNLRDVELEDANGPNKLSEDILKCLISMYSRNNKVDKEAVSSIFGDPYGICHEFGRRDIGPYIDFYSIETKSVDLTTKTGSSLLVRRLKLLLRKLTTVDLLGLTHQQKLAFWINIYNSCMMNAFLEHGIPTNAEMLIATIPKAMVNVGGHSINATTIEHFILRLPYQSKNSCPKGIKNDEITTRGIFGLDWPEPLVTFALSCGSWSSPAVRMYTADQVDKQLETAKQEYLQAAIGISMPNKLAIPKLLDWYLLDFAKDVESLMDWICLQLPSKLRNDALKCIEMSRKSNFPQPIQVLPYEFRFRYIFAL